MYIQEKIIEEIIDLFFYNSQLYNTEQLKIERLTEIGLIIYETSGFNGMVTFLQTLINTLHEREYSNTYLRHVIELENLWFDILNLNKN